MTEGDIIRAKAGGAGDYWLLGPSIDLAVSDSLRTSYQRLGVYAFTAVLIGFGFGLLEATLWLATSAGAEGLALMLFLQRKAEGVEHDRVDRAMFLVCLTLVTINWSLLIIGLWIDGRLGFRFAAIIIACAMLLHAQAFSYRSLVVLALTGLLPAATLALLFASLPGLSAVEKLGAECGLLVLLVYAGISAFANRQAAEALDASRRELEDIAYSDALTGLANRRRFILDLRQKREAAGGRRFALLLIDLDRLKETNDQLGHDAGDALLLETAARLRKFAGANDLVSRLGGDEFALLLSDLGRSRSLKKLCDNLQKTLSQPLEWNGTSLMTSASIGLAVHPTHGASEQALYKAADLALYAAKREGKDRWRLFDAAEIAA